MSEVICRHGIEVGPEDALDRCTCCRAHPATHGSLCADCLDGAAQPALVLPTERPELSGVDLRTQPERVRDGLAALEPHELDALRRRARRKAS